MTMTYVITMIGRWRIDDEYEYDEYATDKYDNDT